MATATGNVDDDNGRSHPPRRRRKGSARHADPGAAGGGGGQRGEGDGGFCVRRLGRVVSKQRGGKEGEEEEEEEAGPKAEGEEGEVGREEGERRGDDCAPLLVAAGEDIQRSGWGYDGRPRQPRRRRCEAGRRRRRGTRQPLLECLLWFGGYAMRGGLLRRPRQATDRGAIPGRGGGRAPNPMMGRPWGAVEVTVLRSVRP